MLRDHFFECLLRLVSVGGSGEFVGVMDASDNEFFVHSYGEDGIAFFEFLIPTVVGIVIREYELFSHAMAAAEDDRAALPVHTRIMALEPIVSEVYVLLTEVSLRQGRCVLDDLRLLGRARRSR